MYNTDLSETMNKIINYIVDDYDNYNIDLSTLDDDSTDDAIRDAFMSEMDNDMIYTEDQKSYVFDEMGITDWSGYGYDPITNLTDLACTVLEFEFFEDGGYEYLVDRLRGLRDKQDDSIEFSRKIRGRKVTASTRVRRINASRATKTRRARRAK